MNEQITFFIAFLESVPTFMEMRFVLGEQSNYLHTYIQLPIWNKDVPAFIYIYGIYIDLYKTPFAWFRL